jgi:toluene monooxygenase electron transfer component
MSPPTLNRKGIPMAMKVQVRARNRAYDFTVSEHEKILFGGLRNGIELPYECATGTCGTCKAKLIEGEIDDLWPNSPAKKHVNLSQGEFLSCQCAARSDLILEIRGFVGDYAPGRSVPRHFNGRISDMRNLTKDVAAFSIDLDQPCDFDAGQFMAVQFEGIPGFRGYSMVNYASRPQRLDFVIKRLPGGAVSERLFGAGAPPLDVELFGPLGKATFHPSLDKNLLCIAGGSGIAGMISILSRAVQANYFSTRKGYVFFGVRTARDLFFAEELQALKAQFPEHLRVVIVLSDENETGLEEAARQYPRLEFDSGFVHEAAGRHMKGAYDDIMAYLAGPPPAVDAAIRLLLLEARLTTDAIRYDKFS